MILYYEPENGITLKAKLQETITKRLTEEV